MEKYGEETQEIQIPENEMPLSPIVGQIVFLTIEGEPVAFEFGEDGLWHEV